MSGPHTSGAAGDRLIKVLLVEDDPECAILLEQMLAVAKRASFSIERADGLSATLEQLAGGEFDVILLDLLLPDSRGLATFVKVQAQAPDVPIVVLTSLDDRAAALQVLRDGGQDYLLKGRVDAETLSRAVCHAMERKRAEKTHRWRSEALATLHKTGQALTSTLDLGQVLTQAMSEVRALLRAEAASVLLYAADSEELFFAAAVGPSSDTLIGTRMPSSAGLAGWALREMQPVLVRDAQTDARFYAEIDRSTGLTTRSLLAAPLTYKGRAIGVIEAISRDEQAFDEHDLELLTTLAGSAAIAIENARLYEETTRRLAETRVLREVMLAAASTLDIDQVLTRAVEAIHRTLGVEYLAFALPDESGEHLVAHPSLISSGSSSDAESHLPLEGSLCGRVYRTGAAELVRASDAEKPREEASEPYSELAAPVRVGDRVIAVLHAASPRPDAFAAEDLGTFEAIAAQLGVVMENARLYAAEREQRILVEQSHAQLVQSEKLAATGRLAASLAHEINNPLQAIHNSLQLVLSFPLEADEEKEYLQMADEEVARLIDIVSRMLDFARPSQQEVKPAQLNEAIEGTLALAGKYLQHRNVVLQRELAPDLTPVQAIPGELRQVFLNLILNAVDAMPHGGTLHVSSRATENDYQAVTFTDTGRGIPPEHLEQIFEPFFSTKEWGTGLGLSVSRNVIKRHGGEITVESEVGEGTSFTVWLPTPEDV